MTTDTTLSENLKRYRRRAGLSQQGLADAADVSVSTVQKAEQGRGTRMDTVRAFAVVLNVTTATLLDEGDRQLQEPEADVNLLQLRAALTPALGITGIAAGGARDDNAPDLDGFLRGVRETRVLYFNGLYPSVASRLPEILKDADQAVAYYDSGDQRQQAQLARAEALRLAGLYLTQTRQFDLAYTAIRGALADAQAAGDTLAAASGVGGMCWLLVRQRRLDEAERVAVETMTAVEPRITGATPDEYAAWGGLAMEAAAAAIRNNRPAEAKEYRQAAQVAATAVGVAHRNIARHWSVFGRTVAAVKDLEDAMIVGDAQTVVRRAAEDEALSPKTWRKLGAPSSNDANRHTLDVASAHVKLGDLTAGMEELISVRDQSPEWLQHQTMAADTMREILRRRKRTLTTDMREMANFLNVVG